jgi:hypothetical protein
MEDDQKATVTASPQIEESSDSFNATVFGAIPARRAGTHTPQFLPRYESETFTNEPPPLGTQKCGLKYTQNSPKRHTESDEGAYDL